MDESYLNWPFFDERHRALAKDISAWALEHCGSVEHGDVDATCRRLVRELGQDGWLNHTAPGADQNKIDVRTLSLIRQTLSSHSGLADFVFAMQGLGAGPISLFGNEAQRNEWLPQTR